MDALPTLYKRTSTGAIEQWTIRVFGNTIETEYGHVNGKMQVSREVVREGKNLGKANETTPEEQAKAQAKSEHTVKLTRKGYVDSLKKAEAGENAGAGGIRPMLAKPWEDVAKKFKGKRFVQPKLDGMRCIAVVDDDGEVTLWTREQKPILAVPRVAEYVKTLKLAPGTVLDGELYNHDLKDDFETLISIFRKQYAASPEEQAQAEYHVYDLPRHPDLKEKASFSARILKLEELIHASPVVRIVETLIADSDEAQEELRQEFVGAGYEGAMARADAEYQEGKRSSYLAKLKVFVDDEFPIIGVKEGKGKMEGKAIFTCEAKNGKPFDVKLEGELEGLRKYLQDESTWKGKQLTVKYFTLTRKNRVPRFPVGKCLRDYE
jgi:DNA ligase-1